MFAQRTYDEDIRVLPQLQPTGQETISQTVGFFGAEPPLTGQETVSETVGFFGAEAPFVRWVRYTTRKDKFLQGSVGSNQKWLPTNTIDMIVGFEPGKAALRLKLEIKNLIDKFEGEASVFAPNFVSPEVARSAKKFVDLIPLDRKLPKVDADGEGAMMFLWPDSDQRLLVVVEADRLHIALNATVPDAQYIPDLLFDGTALPEVLVATLPI